MGGLFGDAHGGADGGPGGAAAPGLVHEVSDQVIGDLAEMVGDGHRVGQMVQGSPIGVQGADGGDEVVQSDGRKRVLRHSSIMT